MKKTLLSKAADADLEDIFDYTLVSFGIDQAITYVSGFDSAFESIAINPKIGRERLDIRAALYSVLHDKHIIFYRIDADNIRIVRILHQARDLPKFFR